MEQTARRITVAEETKAALITGRLCLWPNCIVAKQARWWKERSVANQSEF